jgi:hypothetical protein
MNRNPALVHRRDRIRRHFDQPRKSVEFAVVTLAVLVVSQLPLWPYTATRVAVLPAAILNAVPAGDPAALTYPYDSDYVVEPMLWQAEDDYRFRILGGYAYHPNSRGKSDVLPSPMSPPGLQNFLTRQEGITHKGSPMRVTTELVATTRTTLSKYGVKLVIVDRSLRGSRRVVELFNEALGSPTVSSGQFTLWSGWSRQS